jgi:hypothetical protein
MENLASGFVKGVPISKEGALKQALRNLVEDRQKVSLFQQTTKRLEKERTVAISKSKTFGDVFNNNKVRQSVFHGTDAPKIIEFEKRKSSGIGIGVGIEAEGEAGFWFTSDKSSAGGMGENIIEAKLNIKNPLIREGDVYFNTQGTERLSAISEMEAEGRDGIIFIEPLTKEKWYFVPNKEQIVTTDFFNQATKGIKEVKPEIKAPAEGLQLLAEEIPKELEPLAQANPELFKAAQEAKAKGMSAEEFVNSVGKIPVGYDWKYLDEMKADKAAGYSYSYSDFARLSKLEKANRRTGVSETFYRAGVIGKDGDIWLTPQKSGAEQYARSGGTKVGEYKINTQNPLELKDISDIEKIVGKTEGRNFVNNPDLKQKVIDYAKKNGYDSVSFPDSFPDGKGGMESLVVFDKSKVYTKSQLTDFYTQATKGIKEVKPEIKAPAEVPPTEIPIVGETKPSGVARAIEAKAIENGLVKSGFNELADYSPTTIKEQAQRIADLMSSNIEQAKRMATGKEAIPPETGIRSEALFSAIRDYAMEKRDGQLMLDLAKSPIASEISAAGSKLSLSRPTMEDSAFSKIQQVRKELEKVAEKRLKGKSPAKVKEAIKDSLKEKIAKTKPSKYSWENFIKEITC